MDEIVLSPIKLEIHSMNIELSITESVLYALEDQLYISTHAYLRAIYL